MKKVQNIVTFVFIICFSFFFYASNVHANSISNISMDIYIDEKGNAQVEEVWQAYLTSGTEGYKTFTKMGKAYINNVQVSDDSGTIYEFKDKWDSSQNFGAKKYKSGINYLSNGYELCWGISQYGLRTYTLKYEIVNFVTQYTDKQGIYFSLINQDMPVHDVDIKIHSIEPLSLDNARIWALGFEGTIDFQNGDIVIKSREKVTAEDRVVLLVRFEKNLYTTDNMSEKSFDDEYDAAFTKDVDTIVTEKEHFYLNIVIKIISSILVFGSFIFIFVMAIYYSIFKKKIPMDLGWGIMSRIKNAPYWRDIPCEKDLIRAYWVCLNYQIVSPQKLKKGIIGALFLKYVQNGNIRIEKNKNWHGKRDYAIYLDNLTDSANDFEKKFQKMLRQAAGKNNILESHEFYKWSRNNCDQLDSWFDSLDNAEQKALEKDGLITTEEYFKKGLFGRRKKRLKKVTTPTIQKDALELAGLKKFLNDFSQIGDREFIEVHLWREYLIFAVLFGIGDTVNKQFKKLYPEIDDLNNADFDFTLGAVIEISNNSYRNMANQIRRNHDYSGTSAFSGGGGSSFSGGGSSSGGSSGGGFR